MRTEGNSKDNHFFIVLSPQDSLLFSGALYLSVFEQPDGEFQLVFTGVLEK
jgi:hypothetical protein